MSETTRRWAGWAGVAAGAVYLGWRLVATTSGTSPVAFALLWLVEAAAVVRLGVEVLLGAGPSGVAPSPHDPPSPAPTPGQPGQVDVVVVADDEPVSEVRAALLAARLVEGRGAVSLALRERRPDLDALCSRLEIEVHTGGGSTARAVRAAAGVGDAPFVAVVPADTVVLPDLMTMAAPALADPGVGVVVTRVEITNADNPIDHGGYGAEQIRDSLWSPRLDAAAALPWWPGPGVVRRQAWETIEPDRLPDICRGVTLAAGLDLRSRGWRIRFEPTPGARRLADWDDRRHLHRHARDLHEGLVVTVHPALRAARRGVPRLERLALAAAWAGPIAVLRLAVIVGLAVAVAGTSASPVGGPTTFVAAFWAVRVAAMTGARAALLAPVGWRAWVAGDIRRGATDLCCAVTALRLRPLDASLTDTPPGFVGRRLLGLVCAAGGAVAAVAIGLGLVRTDHSDLVLFGAVTAGGWLVGAVVQARAALRLRQERRSFRTFGELPVVAAVGGRDIRVIGVSPFGLDIVSSTPLRRGAKLHLVVDLPRADGTTVRFATPGVVRRVSSGPEGHVAYVRFAHLDDEHADLVAEYCAVVAGMAAMRRRGAGRDAVAT